jgi:hypothetical protein
VREDKIQ